jgi:hypothetical protein
MQAEAKESALQRRRFKGQAFENLRNISSEGKHNSNRGGESYNSHWIGCKI